MQAQIHFQKLKSRFGILSYRRHTHMLVMFFIMPGTDWHIEAQAGVDRGTSVQKLSVQTCDGGSHFTCDVHMNAGFLTCCVL